VAAATICLAALTGCGAGQISQTAEQQSRSAGAVAESGVISLLDVAFVFDPPVAGDEVYGLGQAAPLKVTIVNSGERADRLVAVTSPVASGATVAAGEVTIPGGGTVTAGQYGPLAQIELPYENAVGPIALTGLTEPIRSGLDVPVVFHFERAGAVRVEVPVDTPDIPEPRAGQDPP
jgi:copper(I)-binding protein